MDFLPGLVLLVLLTLLSPRRVLTQDTVSVELGRQTLLQLPAQSSTDIDLDDISSTYVYCTIQAHTHQTEVTLSWTDPARVDTSWTSTDTGIVSRLDSGQTSLNWFLYNNADSVVDVLVLASCFDSEAPLIGGCNHEFNMENDANIHHTELSYITTITYQPSNIGTLRDTSYSCDIPNTSLRYRLTYDVYVMYLKSNSSSSLFTAMSKMMTRADIVQHADEVISYSSDDLTLKVGLTGFPDQGAIYTIVVNDPVNGAAPYFPTTSYGCSDIHTDCEYYTDHKVFVLFLVSLLGLVGIFLLVCGHRFLKTELFIFGYLMWSMVGYLILCVDQELPTMSLLMFSVLFGMVGGFVYVFLWWRLGTPIVIMAIVGVTPGILIAAVIMFTPFVNFTIWATASNYWLGFTVGSLLVCLITVSFPKLVSIFSCSLIGSYLVTLALDVYLGGHYKYIVLFVVSHAGIPGFSSVVRTVPFTETDQILAAVWATLFLFGILFLVWRERNNPPFPPSPYAQWRLDYENRTRPESSAPSPPSSPPQPTAPDERTPLVSRIA